MVDAVAMLSLPFLACLTIVVIVGYLGLHVLKREVIFIDIALAQMAAVGVIVPHIAFHVRHDSALTYVFPLVFTTGAAAFYALVRRHVVQIPLEAVIGVSYAIAAGAALFLIGVTPGGHVHVKHMLMGSILWTTGAHIAQCALVFAAVGLLLYFARKPLRRISDDYEAAVREGMRVALWDFLFYALLGIVIVLAVRVAGVVLVFCLLIIPATTSALFSAAWGVRLALTWVFGAVAAMTGLVFAYCLDFSLGPSVAMFSGLILIAAALSSYSRRPKLVGGAATCLLALCTLSLLAVKQGRGTGAKAPAVPQRAEAVQSALPLPAPKTLSSEEVSQQTTQTKDAAELQALFAKAPNAQTRTDIVCRALDLDTRTGARLLLEFLQSDPPLFFRAEGLEKLREAIGEPVGFDAAQDFTASVNQQAAAKLAARLQLDVDRRER